MVQSRQDPPAMFHGSSRGKLLVESNACDSIIKALCVGAGQNMTIEDAASKYLKSQMQALMETGSISSSLHLSDLDFLKDESKLKDFQSSIRNMFEALDVCHDDLDETAPSEDATSKDCHMPRAASSSTKFMPQKPVRRPSVHPNRWSSSISRSNHGDDLIEQIIQVVTALERLDRAEENARRAMAKNTTPVPKGSRGECQGYTNATRHRSHDARSPSRTAKTSSSLRREEVRTEESPRRSHSHAQPNPATFAVPSPRSPRKKALPRDTIGDASSTANRGRQGSQLKGSRSASSRDLIESSIAKRKGGSQSSKGQGTSKEPTRPRGSEGSGSISHAKAHRRKPESQPQKKCGPSASVKTHAKEKGGRAPVEFDFDQEESHSSSSTPRRGRGVSSSVPRRGRSRSVVRARSRSVSLSSRNLSKDLASESVGSPRSHRSFFLLDPDVPEPLPKPRLERSSGSRRPKNDGGTAVQNERLLRSALSSASLLSHSRGSTLSSGSGETTRTAPAVLCDHHERGTASALAAAEFYDRSRGSDGFPASRFSRRTSKEAAGAVARRDQAGTAMVWPSTLQACPSFDESDPLFSFDDSFSAFLSANRHRR
jgi:hypothetical protein